MLDSRTVLQGMLVGTAVVTIAASAFAQGVNRDSLDVKASTGAPEFRDARTGQVWTPETVGQDGRPLTGPDDKAFDPGAQNPATFIVEQRVRGRPVGTVPVTAGPTTPVVAMDGATLRAIPGQRWQVVLYLDNNSATSIEPVLECRFTNSGNPVMVTRARIASTGPSVRQGLVVHGPRTEVFVDRAVCNVISP